MCGVGKVCYRYTMNSFSDIFDDSKFANTMTFGAGYLIMMILGALMGVSMGLVSLFIVIGALASETAWLFFLAVIFAGICIPCCIIGIIGAKGRKLLRRFNRYKSLLGTRSVVNIADIARGMRLSEQTVVADMRLLIDKRWFKQGHLTDDNTALIVTDAAWNEYLLLEQRRAASQAKESKDSAPDTLTGDARTVYTESAAFIEQLKSKRGLIRDGETADSVERLILRAEKIMARLREYPSSAAKLEKFSGYFLPTACKLLDNYIQIEDDGTSGTTAVQTLSEIRQALVTLSGAFDRLLDSLYQDTAWDISSDITVLNAVLAREGLCGNSFTEV